MKTSLANILSRKKTIAALLRQAADFSPEHWCIEDADGHPIVGEMPAKSAYEQPILVEGKIVGRLKSQNEGGKFVAALLENWLRQESEKRQLGSETLHLYREINLIFSFAEKLSATIGTKAIARLTLQEAGQIIRLQSGNVFLLNEKTGKVNRLAEADEDGDTPNLPDPAAQKIVKSGKSEILTAPDGSAGMWLVGAMKIGQRALGSIILKGENFAAADLKLLSTLATLAAAALENSVQHERATAAALKEQREKLTLELAYKNPFFKKIMAVIEEKYTDPEFSVGHLAEAVHLSVSQLQRKIATMTELTPVQIIRDLRFARAKELLRNTDLNVAEVAFQSGFNDPSYFSRLFSKEFGGSPTEWAEAQLKGGFQAIQENKIMKMYVDEGVLQFMGDKSEDEFAANETIEATVVFVDICGFTAISEQEPPDVVVRLLNRFFDCIVPSIIAAGGVVDKFIGDAVLAVFKNEDHLLRAVRATLDIHLALEKAERMTVASNPDFQPRATIGLNTGEVISGNVGSAALRRFDFTVIGDVVNTAQRLQSIAQPGQILLNESTFSRLEGHVACREVGGFDLKNKARAVRVFEVLR
jgi:class 3 adenylate cyclase/AraC-like DNA-binding protein